MNRLSSSMATSTKQILMLNSFYLFFFFLLLLKLDFYEVTIHTSNLIWLPSDFYVNSLQLKNGPHVQQKNLEALFMELL